MEELLKNLFYALAVVIENLMCKIKRMTNLLRHTLYRVLWVI